VKEDRLLRIGVLGAGQIAQAAHFEACVKARNADLHAICDVAEDLLARAAAAFQPRRTFASYDAMLADRDVEAVIVATADAFHVEAAIAALQAGKHVLCEKPLALGVDEAETMVAAAARTGGKLMEAFMYRFHPQWELVRNLIAAGRIGPLRMVNSWFTYEPQPEDDYRNVPEAGGGVLLDIGCYCVSVARFLFGTEPTVVGGAIRRDGHGVDIATAGILRFPEGESVFFWRRPRPRPGGAPHRRHRDDHRRPSLHPRSEPAGHDPGGDPRRGADPRIGRRQQLHGGGGAFRRGHPARSAGADAARRRPGELACHRRRRRRSPLRPTRWPRRGAAGGSLVSRNL